MRFKYDQETRDRVIRMFFERRAAEPQDGGIAPTPRKRRPQFLSLAEREEISRGLAAGKSLRQIARDLKRAPSSISREVKRNKGARHYRAVDADDRAWRRAKRRRPCRLAEIEELRAFVAGKLADDWSPEQIAGHLAKHHPVGSHMRISHETIYKSLFIQTRGVLKRELRHLHLRGGSRQCSEGSRDGRHLRHPHQPAGGGPERR